MRDRDAFLILLAAAAVAVIWWRLDRLEYGVKRVLTDLHRRV